MFTVELAREATRAAIERNKELDQKMLETWINAMWGQIQEAATTGNSQTILTYRSLTSLMYSYVFGCHDWGVPTETAVHLKELLSKCGYTYETTPCGVGTETITVRW